MTATAWIVIAGVIVVTSAAPLVLIAIVRRIGERNAPRTSPAPARDTG